MSKDLSIENVRRFWNTEAGVRSTGVVALGGGGDLEIDYRAYFELKHFRKIVPLDRSMSLLELGCGTGRWADALARRVGQYEGVDFSAPSLAIARRMADARRLRNVQFHHCAVEEFHGGRPYDVIYFSGVTQYMSDDAIRQTLLNLSPCMTSATVIVDRSTVRSKEREVRNAEGMCPTIYRTPQEILGLYATIGFQLCYQRRTYRFLRGCTRLNRLLFTHRASPVPQIFVGLIRHTRPVSLYLLLAATALADVVRRAPWNNGNGSHDFFLFKRGDAAPSGCRPGVGDSGGKKPVPCSRNVYMRQALCPGSTEGWPGRQIMAYASRSG